MFIIFIKINFFNFYFRLFLAILCMLMVVCLVVRFIVIFKSV